MMEIALPLKGGASVSFTPSRIDVIKKRLKRLKEIL